MGDLYRYTEDDLKAILWDLRDMLHNTPKYSEETRWFLLGEIIAIKRELVKRWKPKDAA